MGNVIAFIPASGGLGASTLAAAVAVRAAAATRSVVAVDLDRLGGRLDVLFGVEASPGWRWPDLAEVSGVVDGAGLAAELPVACGVSVLTGSGLAGWGPVGRGGEPGSGAPAAGPTGAWTDSPDVVLGGSAGGYSGGSARARDETSGWALGEDPWLETLPDVVEGLADAHDLVVLDLPRDVGVLASVAPLLHAVVVVLGTRVDQLATGAVVVPGVRRVLAGLRDPRRDWEAAPLLPLEPWVVLRGGRVEPALEDLVMDELDVPVMGCLRDDRRLLAELVDGLPPGARGRGDVVDVADAVLLRLVEQEVAA